MKRLLTCALACSILSAPVLAQPAAKPPAPPMTKGPAGPNPPVAITPDKDIPFDQALDAARTAMDACLALPKKSAAVVMVVDLNGNTRIQMSPDGTGLPFYDYARRKAYTVLKKQMPSGEFGAQPQIASQPRNAVLEGDPELITFPGALPIKKNSEIIGAIAVSGPTGGVDDLKCAQAGAAKFHF
jgi:uncharacterized protein GlcG (DUF336 family)